MPSSHRAASLLSAAFFAYAIPMAGAQSLDPASVRKDLLESILPQQELDERQIFSRCIDLGEVSIQHAPFSSAAEVDDFVAGVDWAATQRFFTTGRLNSTATNPGPMLPRLPLTVTFSFVPDGTNIPSQPGVTGSVAGPSNLFSTMDPAFSSVGGRVRWQGQIRTAFKQIGDLTGITYIEVGDDGATFPSSVGSNTSGAVRGDIRIAMRPFAGAGGTLAYNFLPNTSDMVLDSQDIAIWTDSSKNYRRFRNLVMHEHGHGLGYLHVFPASQDQLMEPDITTAFDGPQEDDKRGFQYQYGDGYETNYAIDTAADLGAVTSARPAITVEANLEAHGNESWFLIEVPDETLPLSICVRPVGGVYQNAPAADQKGIEDGKSVLDLRLHVEAGAFSIDRNLTGIGGTECAPTLLPFAGYYFIRVDSASLSKRTSQRFVLEIYGLATDEDCNTNGIDDRYDSADLESSVPTDNCFVSLPIEPGLPYTGDTNDSTPSGTINCSSVSTSNDDWFTYIPATNGLLDVTLCSDTFGPLVSISRNCAETSLAPAACGTAITGCDTTGAGSFIDNFAVTAGETYFVRAGGIGAGKGVYSLTLDGPETYAGRSQDNNFNSIPDDCEDTLEFANYDPFDTGFNYGETAAPFTSIPASLNPPNIPGYSGSAPEFTPVIGFTSTAAQANQFATWRKNIGFPIYRDTIHRVRARLETNATLGASNAVRLRFGGDFMEANGSTEYGFSRNAAALPAIPRIVELYHWSKYGSQGSSAPDNGDQPALNFDIIDESTTVGGHFARMSDVTIDLVPRQSLTEATVIRNKGIARVSREDGWTPPSTSRTPFSVGDGYTSAILNDTGSSVTFTASTTSPSAGAMNVTFGTTASGNQTGFSAVFVDLGANPAEARVTIDPTKLYAIDTWISPAAAPNASSVRPPILRMRWTPEQIAFNQGQNSISSFNLNPDPNYDAVYDNPSGLATPGRARRYTSFWSPSLDTTAQPSTSTLYFLDFMFNRTGTSAVRPRGTYTIERFVVTRYDKPIL